MDKETFVNIHLHPKAYYDNPSDGSDEKSPILADRSVDIPYTTESTKNSQNLHATTENDEEEVEPSTRTKTNNKRRLDIPYRAPRYPLTHLFSVSVCALEIFGVGAVTLLAVWLSYFHEGFGWDGAMKEFNLHPLFMMLGLIFFYSNGEKI